MPPINLTITVRPRPRGKKLMDEQKLLRYGAVAMATIASLALAVTLAVQVTLWAGLTVLVVTWGPVALYLIRLERERLEFANRAPIAEPFVASTWDESKQV